MLGIGKGYLVLSTMCTRLEILLCCYANGNIVGFSLGRSDIEVEEGMNWDLGRERLGDRSVDKWISWGDGFWNVADDFFGSWDKV